MADREHLAILKEGVDVWNRWRAANPAARPNLIGAELREAQLAQADLHLARLRDADLIRGNLHDANLAHADLFGARMSGSDVSGADLTAADLYRVDLTGADLSAARLIRVGMRGTILADVDLSEAIGLDTVRHLGPSTLGIDTVYRSRALIPDLFLRGAGIPEDLITYIRALVGKVGNYFSCFICHSTKDKAFVEDLHRDLQGHGVRVWYFPEDAKWGETVWSEIDSAVSTHDKVIVVCSENSLQSGPVLREIERALQREDREGRCILFPIRIDDYVFNEWVHGRRADVLSRVVGDFRQWELPAKYRAALTKLLRDLAVQTEPA